MALSILCIECNYAEWVLQFIWRYAECRYAECHNAECRYAECRSAFLASLYNNRLSSWGQGFKLLILKGSGNIFTTLIFLLNLQVGPISLTVHFSITLTINLTITLTVNLSAYITVNLSAHLNVNISFTITVDCHLTLQLTLQLTYPYH